MSMGAGWDTNVAVPRPARVNELRSSWEYEFVECEKQSVAVAERTDHGNEFAAFNHDGKGFCTAWLRQVRCRPIDQGDPTQVSKITFRCRERQDRDIVLSGAEHNRRTSFRTSTVVEWDRCVDNDTSVQRIARYWPGLQQRRGGTGF